MPDMHLQTSDEPGSTVLGSQDGPFVQFRGPSSTPLFGQEVPLSSIRGPMYLTAQALIQQVSYALSDKLFTYSPETFDLDIAVKNWYSDSTPNAHGYATQVSSMQTRAGAASIALGYIFSKDFDLKK